MKCEDPSQPAEPQEQSKRKRSYTRPTLLWLGNMRDVTLGMGGSNYDSGQVAPSKRGHG